MEKVSYYTEKGLQQLKNELIFLKTKERAKVAEQLAEARGQGDLTENAEYDAAKEAQERLETRITKLAMTLANAKVISEADINTSRVSILSKVRIKNKNYDQESTFTLVSKEEADLKVGKLSIESPIGKGLLGKKVGENAIVKVPSGELTLEVLEIGL